MQNAAPYNSPLHRFFAPALDPGDDLVVLPKDEAEHATRVLRLSAGDEVSVFDGRGREFLGRIAAAARRDVQVQLLSRIDAAPETAVPITLVQAVLKADKMDDVVRDAVMLGAAAIQPVVTSRSETTVAALSRAAKVERWQRVALASVKQSRRAVLPEVRRPLTFENWIAEPRATLTMMLVEPGAMTETAEPFSRVRDEPPPADAAVMVGPEGGWAEAERTAARENGIRLMTFGQRTLRADAVPVAVLSVLQFLWDSER